MTDSQKEKEHKMRQCLLYEVFDGMSVFEAYKDFCKTMGNDAMEYIDFDYYFYQFYRTDNYHFDRDKKLASKALLFCDLPTDMIGLIVGKLDLKNQLVLRKVSHNLQTIIDMQKLAYDNIYVAFDTHCLELEFNENRVVYTHPATSSLVKFNESVKVKRVESDDFVEMAFNDLAIAMKNPKNQLNSLQLDYICSANKYDEELRNESSKKLYGCLEHLLKSLKHKIAVKQFSIMARNQEEVMTILPYLNSNLLERIEMSDVAFWKSDGISELDKVDQLVMLDQWKRVSKQAKLELRVSLSVATEAFFHSSSFRMSHDYFTKEEIVELRDALFKFESFEICWLDSLQELDMEAIEEALGPYVSRYPDCPDNRSYPIPNSTHFIDIFVDEYEIEIEKSY